MGERHQIEIKNPRLTGTIWTVYGLTHALEALKAVKAPANAAPGFALAVATVERELAEERVNLSQLVLRAAAGAGFDISQSPGVYTSVGKDGSPVLEIETADLADMAGAD